MESGLWFFMLARIVLHMYILYRSPACGRSVDSTLVFIWRRRQLDMWRFLVGWESGKYEKLWEDDSPSPCFRML
jgi:hypothetical protein